MKQFICFPRNYSNISASRKYLMRLRQCSLIRSSKRKTDAEVEHLILDELISFFIYIYKLCSIYRERSTDYLK